MYLELSAYADTLMSYNEIILRGLYMMASALEQLVNKQGPKLINTNKHLALFMMLANHNRATIAQVLNL